MTKSTHRPSLHYLYSLGYLVGLVIIISGYLFYANGNGPLSFLIEQPQINAVGGKCKVEKDEYVECTDASGKTTTTTYKDGHVNNVTTTRTIVERDPELGVIGRTTISNTVEAKYNPKEGVVETVPTGTNTTVIKEKTYERRKNDEGKTEVVATEQASVTRVIEKKDTPKETVKITVQDPKGNVTQEQTFKTGEGEKAQLKLRAGTGVGAAGENVTLPSGKNTCNTSGNPVQEGTWAATGNYTDNSKPSPDTAQCKQCGSDGSFSGETKTCQQIIGTNPVVLPSHLETIKLKDGIIVEHKKCFAKVDGNYLQVAPGSSFEDEDGSTKYCKPDGGLTDSKEDLTTNIQSMCSINGQVASDGKCVAGGNAGSPPNQDPPKLQCGPGLTPDGIYCKSILIGDKMDPIHEANKLKCGTQPYDRNTGLCQNLTAGKPFVCKDGVSDTPNGQTLTKCNKQDGTSVVTGSNISFCRTPATFVNGVCTLPPTSFGANPATINSPIRQVSSKSDCGSGETYTSKSIGGNFAYFCSTNDGTNNNKPIIIPQNSPIRQVNSKNDCRSDENYTSFSTSGEFISVCVEDKTKQDTESSDSDTNVNPPAVNPRTGQLIDNTSDDSSGFWNWLKGVFAPATFNPRTGQGTGNEASEPLGNTENTESSDSDTNVNPPAVNPRTGQSLDSSTDTTSLWETIKSWFTSSNTFNPRTGQGVEEGELPAGTRCYIAGDENLCGNCVNREFHDKDNNPLNGNELICGE